MPLGLGSRTSALVIPVVFLSLAASGQTRETKAPLSQEAARWEHRITGKIVSLKRDQLEVETHEKRRMQVDASEAVKNKRANALSIGSLITVFGAYDAKGVLHAQSVQRAKKLPSAWPADR